MSFESEVRGGLVRAVAEVSCCFAQDDISETVQSSQTTEANNSHGPPEPETRNLKPSLTRSF